MPRLATDMRFCSAAKQGRSRASFVAQCRNAQQYGTGIRSQLPPSSSSSLSLYLTRLFSPRTVLLLHYLANMVAINGESMNPDSALEQARSLDKREIPCRPDTDIIS